MKKSAVILVTIVLTIITGLVMPQFMKTTTFCTKMMCYPKEPSEANAEVPCNACSQSQFMFVPGILNVVKSCEGREMLIFENSVHINEKDRIEIDYTSCKYKIKTPFNP